MSGEEAIENFFYYKLEERQEILLESQSDGLQNPISRKVIFRAFKL